MIELSRLACFALVLFSASTLSACAASNITPAWKQAVAGDGPGNLSRLDVREPVVTNLPKSRSGNSANYEVFGTRYQVLESAKGFQETGVASWYGSKFHGNATASGEIYDMHTMTAAHKSLPLPTFVRVTRLDNRLSIVVKVNDRGPFVGDRVIDLSYAAAAQLGMLESGKAEVHVEALSHHEHSRTGFLQVGAFGDSDNAQALGQRLRQEMGLPVQIDFESARQLHHVRVGPLVGEKLMNNTAHVLASSGISSQPVWN